MKLLLDTCAFLWIVTDDPSLSDAAREAVEDPDNEVFLSAISAWEIALKYSLGRLPLDSDPETYLPDTRRRHGIASLPLAEDSVVMLGKLPAIHKDPFDRMLVCQALQRGMTLLTPDAEIARYPVRTLW